MLASCTECMIARLLSFFGFLVSGEAGLDHCSRAQVHRERYVGEYNGGKDLCGCGGGMSPFATQVSANADRNNLNNDTECWQLAKRGPGEVTYQEPACAVPKLWCWCLSICYHMTAGMSGRQARYAQ